MNWLKKEKNMLFAAIILSALGYLSAYLKYESSGKVMAMSPIFGGLYFPITVLIALLVIRYLGNADKVVSVHVVSMRTTWALIWRAFVAHIGASLIMLAVSRIFNFTAEWSYGYQLYLFLGVTWLFAVPAASWLLFASNKKLHIAAVFRSVRGY